MSIERTPDEIVTDHCALRYLERVLEVDVGSIAAAGETHRLAAICRDLGVTPEALKAGILSPTIRAALNAGADRIMINGHWFAFASGRVTTVLLPTMRYARNQRTRASFLKQIKVPASHNARRHELVAAED